MGSGSEGGKFKLTHYPDFIRNRAFYPLPLLRLPASALARPLFKAVFFALFSAPLSFSPAEE
jgi:hypothetical protein